MNCNSLSKRLISWFNDNAGSCRDKVFGFRFRGKESKVYLQHFSSLVSFLHDKVNGNAKLRLIQIFQQSLCLRKVISFSVRIEDISIHEVHEMKTVAKLLFKSYCLFDSSITPSMWILCNVAPSHTEECMTKLNLGLGVNTMEGREQKHQQIAKYSFKSTFQERWSFIFRHEYIQLLYLRQNGFDLKKYNQRAYKYLPDIEEGCCSCSLSYINGQCSICEISNAKN